MPDIGLPQPGMTVDFAKYEDELCRRDVGKNTANNGITTLNANSNLNFGPLKSQMSGMETIYL